MEDHTPNTLPGDADVTSQGGEGTVTPPVSLTLEELNSALGKKFDSKESAVKSIKDTFAYVGKKKEDVEKEVVKEVTNSVDSERIAQLETELFFQSNSELKDARPIIEALAKANGQTLKEAAESKVFQDTFAKLKGAEKPTVMDAGRRFGDDSDARREFQEALGNKEKMAAYVLKNYINK
jgi:hypothetical protein